MEDPEEGSQLEEEEEVIEDPDELAKTLIKVAAIGNCEETQGLIRRRANVNYRDKKGWTPLLWAAGKGHVDVVKLLLDSGALHEEEPNKYTPLHWASFNGHLYVVWLLMKRGFSPLDLDVIGNNCIHHAAAGSRLDILETFIGSGVSADKKNTRGHSPYDLATSPVIKAALKSARNAEKCHKCVQLFDLHRIRHLCYECKKYYCNSCCKINWVFLRPESEDEERPVCRCDSCELYLKQLEQDVERAVDTNNFSAVESLHSKLTESAIDIDVKLIHRLRRTFRRLQVEKTIKEDIQALAYVEDYKTIQKSVHVLGLLVEEAKANGIEISESSLYQVRQQQDRLKAERNLRHEVATADFSVASEVSVATLDSLINKAEEHTVAAEYVDSARVIRNKLQDNIDAHYILERFIEYPVREYPELETADPKKRAAAKPEDKKAPPRKKKKEPKLNIPEWATLVSDLVRELDALEKFMKRAEELVLPPEFLSDARENCLRMRKEAKFRQQQEEEARLEAERRAAAKKAAAKK